MKYADRIKTGANLRKKRKTRITPAIKYQPVKTGNQNFFLFTEFKSV
jgi:hypothetical protein